MLQDTQEKHAHKLVIRWLGCGGAFEEQVDARERERAARVDVRVDVRVDAREHEGAAVQPLMWRNRSRALFGKPRLRTLSAQRVYEHYNSYNYQGK